MSYKNQIQGPVIPVPTPFNQDETVDYDGLASYISFLDESGIPAIMTTVGTSRYNLLSWEEITKANNVIAQQCKKAKSIVANPTTGGLKSTIEFGLSAQKAGAEYFLVYFPERHYGEENTYKYFKQLNTALDIKILLHEMPMRNGFGGPAVQYSIPLLERLFQLENIVGLKEEALDAPYSNQIVERFSDEIIIIGAGGGMSRYLNRDFDRGSNAFLGGIGNFNPALELEFYNAIQNGNRARAEEIVKNIEAKYFEAVVPIGWHPSLKEALNIKGLMQVHERVPMKQCSAEERATIQQIISDLDI